MKDLSSSIPSQDGPCELAVNNEGLRLMRSFPKLGLVSLGIAPIISEGPCHPYGHKVRVIQRPRCQASEAWQPRAQLSQEVWVTQHQHLNSSIKEAGPSRDLV